MKKAILFGASGFIGSFLLQELLNSPDYDAVTIVVRKKLATEHAKLTTLIGDLNSLCNLGPQIQGDDVFIALGTTKKKLPHESEYYAVDHDYPVLAAKIAKKNGAKSVSIVTSVGADAGSMFFYIRTKGEVERDIISLGFERTHVFRPSMLLGHRAENRPLEKFLMGLCSSINPLLAGPLISYRGIGGRDVARAMVRAAQMPTGKVEAYQWREMQMLAAR